MPNVASTGNRLPCLETPGRVPALGGSAWPRNGRVVVNFAAQQHGPCRREHSPTNPALARGSVPANIRHVLKVEARPPRHTGVAQCVELLRIALAHNNGGLTSAVTTLEGPGSNGA